LRGYVRQWLANVWSEVDLSIKLTDFFSHPFFPRSSSGKSALEDLRGEK